MYNEDALLLDSTVRLCDGSAETTWVEEEEKFKARLPHARRQPDKDANKVWRRRLKLRAKH